MNRLYKQLKYLVAGITFFCVIGAKTSSVKPKIHTDATRVAIVQRWIKGGESFAKKVNQPRVSEISDYVKKNYIIAKPTTSKALDILVTKRVVKGDVFAIVPLYPEEKNLPVVKSQHIRVKIGAEYVRDTKTLWVIPHEDMSNAFMGAMLIHEGEHILQDKDPRFAKYSQLTFCVGEYFAFSTSLNALRAFGGIKYEKLLQQDVERLIKEYLKDNKFTIRPVYDHRYDSVFGKPSSQDEEEIRAQDIILTYTILAIQRLTPTGDNHFSRTVATFCSYYTSLLQLPFDPNSW